jgi:hypothetical protein
VLAPTAIAAVISFLNAVYSPFEGTIFVFDKSESQASRTAVATSVVVVAVVVARNLRATVAQLGRRAVSCLVASLVLLGCLVEIDHQPHLWPDDLAHPSHRSDIPSKVAVTALDLDGLEPRCEGSGQYIGVIVRIDDTLSTAFS